MPNNIQDDAAIVGMSCRFAGATDLASYWRNIVSNRCALTACPDPDASKLLDPASPRFDRLNTLRGGFLGTLNTFDPSLLGLRAENLAGSNCDQWLALQLAADALRDAGLWPRLFPADRASFFLGYASPLNPATANWLQHGLVLEQTLDVLRNLLPHLTGRRLNELRQALRSTLPPIQCDGLRSAFGHALAGQCAATLGLGAAACAVDAGAASSTLALRLALDDLRLGRCDVALCGAVQTCSATTLMGLSCLLPFTTREALCPLSRDADGTLPGEGGGFLVLKRRRDAERNRDPIYAVLKAVGLAAGNKEPSAASAPGTDGLARAMQDALSAADAATVGLIEAHGSGVPREDQAEIQALRETFAERAAAGGRVLVGSVKASIGHGFAAAGMAGVIKAALALHHRLLPPMTGGCRLHPRLLQPPAPFAAATSARPWMTGRRPPPRRALVNALDAASVQMSVLLEEVWETR